MRDDLTLLGGAIVLLIFLWLGWMLAHHEIATECDRQGSFYVGSEDFECRLKPAKDAEAR